MKFTQITTTDKWLYALDPAGRIWRRRHEDVWSDVPSEVVKAEWERVEGPDPRQKKLTDYEKLQQLQDKIREGYCPDGLEPHGEDCPRCGEPRELRRVPPLDDVVWCHVRTEKEADAAE